jgi:hypothetical protein
MVNRSTAAAQLRQEAVCNLGFITIYRFFLQFEIDLRGDLKPVTVLIINVKTRWFHTGFKRGYKKVDTRRNKIIVIIILFGKFLTF